MATTRSHSRGHIKSKSKSQGHSRGRGQSKSKSRRIVPDDSEEENKSFVEGKSFEVGNKKYRNNRDRLVSKLKPGDHIAAKRMSWYYEHHGIYEGEEKGYPSVIHFQGPSSFFYKLLGSDLSSSSCIYKCGYEHPKEGKVVTSCIDCFSQRKTIFKMQYKLQKNLLSHDQDADWNELKPGKIIQGYRKQKYYLEHYKKEQLHGHSSVPTQKRKRSSGGKYTLEDQVRLYQMSSIRSSEQVLEVARQYTSPPYNLLCNNCEHFAVFCTTGENKSYLILERHLTFVCKLRKCFCCFTASGGMSNSGNGNEHRLYPPAKEEEDEENRLLLAKRIKLY